MCSRDRIACPIGCRSICCNITVIIAASLDDGPICVQLVLNVNQAIQHKEQEETASRYVRVSFIPKHLAFHVARQPNIDRRKDSKIVQRMQKRTHDVIKVESIDQQHGDGRVLDILLFPKSRNKVREGSSHVVGRHRHAEQHDKQSLSQRENEENEPAWVHLFVWLQVNSYFFAGDAQQ